MKLSDEQVRAFDERGVLLMPSVFDAEEVAVLRAALPRILAHRGPEAACEPGESGAIRVLYGGHTLDEAFARLARHPRLIGPVEQLLRDRIYIHQSRLNPKQTFDGGTWSWHQDFGTWNYEDGMPEPRCVVTGVFLDEVSGANAPLLVVPGSQHHGLIDDTTLEAEARGYTLLEIDRPTLERLVEEGGLDALTGPAGTVAFVHANLVHGSGNNITPLPRAIFYMIYNAVSNACAAPKRAWHHCNRDTTPLEPLDDDCLRALAREPRALSASILGAAE